MQLKLSEAGWELWVEDHKLTKRDEFLWEAAEQELANEGTQSYPDGVSIYIKPDVPREQKSGTVEFTVHKYKDGVRVEIAESFSRRYWDGFFGLKVMQEAKRALLLSDYKNVVRFDSYDDDGTDIYLVYSIIIGPNAKFTDVFATCHALVRELETRAIVRLKQEATA